ncbi:MAG: methionyl-tRNA formyltransferase [Chloroflexota bacterium]
MARPRVVFLGTPEFAAVALRRLLAPDSPVEVVGVVTQPDRPVGRSRQLVPPPVKALAGEHGLPVLQPLSLRRPAALAALQRLRPDLGIVAAYGHILRPEVLAIPRLGYLNVHASLLPRWRGAWPVGGAILAGDAETGVSIMRLDEGMDTGPVLARRVEPIWPEDTTTTLEGRLAALGAELLVETLPGYVSGQIVPQPQDDRQATYCHMVRKADGVIDWARPEVELERQVRAMQPWPVAFTTWNGKQLSILRARVAPAPAAGTSEDPPGTVERLGKGAAVITGDGLLALEQVQLEGRPPTPVASFVNGYRTFVGSRLGAGA